MTSNLGGDGKPRPRFCLNCYTRLNWALDSAAYPGGAWVAAEGQGMSNLSHCPNLPLMLGRPQAHTPGPEGWTPPEGAAPRFAWIPPSVGRCGPRW